MKTLLSILFMAIIAAGQSINYAGLLDSAVITDFKDDSLRITKAFPWTNREAPTLLVFFDDTANAARSSDSVNAEIGYQIGTPFVGFSGSLDTAWSNFIVLDTINTTTSASLYNPNEYGGATPWVLNRSLEIPVRASGQIDTTLDTASSGLYIPMQTFWAPYCRFYIKGLAANAGTGILCRMYLIQRKWSNVRNQ
jgi:hypothetical protein